MSFLQLFFIYSKEHEFPCDELSKENMKSKSIMLRNHITTFCQFDIHIKHSYTQLFNHYSSCFFPLSHKLTKIFMLLGWGVTFLLKVLCQFKSISLVSAVKTGTLACLFTRLVRCPPDIGIFFLCQKSSLYCSEKTADEMQWLIFKAMQKKKMYSKRGILSEG